MPGKLHQCQGYIINVIDSSQQLVVQTVSKVVLPKIKSMLADPHKFQAIFLA